MERNNQNSEFLQKLNTKSGEALEQRTHKFYTVSRPARASGGDIGSTNINSIQSQFNSASTFQNSKTPLSIEKLQKTEYPGDEGSQGQEEEQHYYENVEKRDEYSEVGAKLKSQLCKYKKELKEYNNTTKDLEEKYLKINQELNEMQQQHDLFLANRNKSPSKTNQTYAVSSHSSSSGSEYSLKRKFTQVFRKGNNFVAIVPPSTSVSTSYENIRDDYNMIENETSFCMGRKQAVLEESVSTRKRSRYKIDNKENEQPFPEAGLKDIYKVLKNVLDNNQKTSSDSNAADIKNLEATISSLQHEQTHFRNIIQQQQTCLHDYHSRCIKAQHIMQTQQTEIEKLNSNNQQLETEITNGIDQLCVKIDSKLKDVSRLPQMMVQEQTRFEKVSKENSMLAERLRVIQGEATQLKLKIEELAHRKNTTMNRLKAAERDLKIFKNYNTALKHEKRKLSDELTKVKEQMESVQNINKRALARQRELAEKQRRELQKRIFELELKLNRSQNSTSGLIQERDNMIAELQGQLNTLVHNFEVSQKHIRVLRRHIYSISGTNAPEVNRMMNNQPV